ncbi:MAG: hypothetical protein K1X67_25775 [Fimbriimonadaceae bacterium]|nr:hypothetical protein [Fimbriimonadaceae bacterium]
MKLNRMFGALAALTLVTALPAIAGQGEVKLTWQPKVGATAKYSMDVDAEGDFGQGPMKIKVTMTLANTVKSVSDKEVVVEGKTSNMKITLDGNELPAPASDETSTSTFAPDGELISVKSSSGQENRRLEQMNAFVYPSASVKPGDTWTREVKGEKGGGVPATAKYSYVGAEKVGKWDCYKVSYTYTETKGDMPTSAKGTAWLDAATGDLVKMDVEMKNVVFQDGVPPMAAKAKMTRTD